MKAMSDALTAAGPQAREMFVLSQLDTLVAQVAAKVKTIQVGAVQVVDAGDGKAVPALAASYPATVATVMRTLKELTGVDVADMLADQPHSNGGAR